MQQTFRQVEPSMYNYRWIPADSVDERDLDTKLVKMYHWNTMDKIRVNGQSQTPAPTMIAFVQEPWVLGKKDFTNFVRTKSVSKPLR